MKMNFKKLTKTAIKPFKAHLTDAGFDLFADEDVTIRYGNTQVVSTGIALELPNGYFSDVRPRSGLTSKTALRVHLGTVDSNYRGCIGIICENGNHKGYEYSLFPGQSDIVINKGDKIAQLVIQKLPDIELVEANDLTDSDRGANGFGSTDKNKNLLEEN